MVREEDVVVSLTINGYIKRVPAREYRAQRRGGKGVIGMQTKEEDGLQEIFFASSLDDLLLFSDKGKVYSQKVYRIPETGRANRGTLIHAILPLSQDEHITAILPVESFEKEGGFFTMVTRHGRIKRVHMQEFADVRNSGIIAISLNEDDYLGWVKYTDGNQEVVLVTENGQSIRFHEDEARPLGRTAAGVNAIRLTDKDVVAGMDVIGAEHTHILVVTANGYGKRTTIDQYLQQGRYGVGVRTLARNDKTGNVVAMRCIKEEDEIMVITRDGIVLRTALNAIRETGRSTQGVTLINIADGDAVASIAIMNQEVEKMPEESQ